MTKREQRKALRALYDRLPRVKCKGLCAASCGPIEASDLEYEIMEKRAGKRVGTTLNHPMFPGLHTCTMLSPNGRCTVYGDRPVICRIWGADPLMRCTHDCEIVNPQSTDELRMELAEAFLIGGGKRASLLISSLDDVRRALDTMPPDVRLRLEHHIRTGMKRDNERILATNHEQGGPREDAVVKE